MRRGNVSVKEYIERMQERYRPAGRGEWGHLLDEVVRGSSGYRLSPEVGHAAHGSEQEWCRQTAWWLQLHPRGLEPISQSVLG